MTSLQRKPLALISFLVFQLFPIHLLFAQCLSSETTSRAAEIVDQTLSDPRYHIPGISLSVRSQCGDEFYYSNGTAVLGQKIPITESTQFRVGSVTKAFTAYMTMLLAQENDNDGSVGHDGNIFGYECSTRYLLKKEIAVAACSNRSLFDQTLPANSSLSSVLMEKIIAIFNSN